MGGEGGGGGLPIFKSTTEKIGQKVVHLNINQFTIEDMTIIEHSYLIHNNIQMFPE